ncbi:MAG: hypothetical protein HDR04_14335 [Lachnospiraceae bacterium]|nr:hypothetical protein [Lachnospiraceae bacterium]
MEKDEKVIPEKDRPGFVQSLGKVHELRDLLEQFGLDDYVLALNRVFEWIDDIVILLNGIGGNRL